jgi:hypothetical protein
MPYFPPASSGGQTSIVAKYSISSSSAVLTNVQINYDNMVIDTNSAVTTGAGAWKFTAPATRTYRVSVVGMNSGVTASMVLWVNGAAYDKLVTVLGGSIEFMSGSTLVPLTAGDYIDIRCDSAATWLGSGGNPYVSEISIESV